LDYAADAKTVLLIAIRKRLALNLDGVSVMAGMKLAYNIF